MANGYKNRLLSAGLGLLLILLSLPSAGYGSIFEAKDYVVVAREDTVADDLYTFGNDSEIRGTITGDLTAFCYSLSCDGEIDGNINTFAYDADIIGRVSKSVRLFGYSLRINGTIGSNAVLYGNDIRIAPRAVIEKDLHFGGGTVNIGGVIHGQAAGAADKLTISGIIDGDVEVEADRILVIAPAEIRGNFKYISEQEAVIDEDVIIGGDVDWIEPKNKELYKEDSGSAFGTIFKIILFLMSLATGLILILLFRQHAREAITETANRFWGTLAIGCLSVIIIVGGALVAGVLVVGLPLALMLVAIGMILLYIGKIYAAILIGRLVSSGFKRDGRIALGFELIIGLIILYILFEIPILGTIVYLAAYVVGSGAIIAGFLSLSRKCKRAISATPSQ